MNPPRKPARTVYRIRDTKTDKTVGADHYLTKDAADRARRKRWFAARYVVEEVTIR